MRIRLSVIALGIGAALSGSPPPAVARARFMGMLEVTARADLIAVITITKSRPTKTKPRGANWRYTQRNVFRIDRVLKQSPHFKLQRSGQILWAKKRFRCARATYAPGRYLVFLRRLPGGTWVTLNHQLGALRITGTRLPSIDGKTTTLTQMRVRVRRALLNGISTQARARVRVQGPWRKGAAYQRVHLTFRGAKAPAKWPATLHFDVPALIPSRALSRSAYSGMRRRVRTLKISGRWRRGVFVLSRLSP